MVQGLDYSFAHPDLACARNRGYEFVARYIGDPDPNSAKYLDGPELDRIQAAGLSVVVVRETSAGFMFEDSGAVHARRSRDHCNALGLTGIPIYYALDVDPRNLSPSQINAVTLFLKDAAGEDGGGGNVGLYAGYAGIERWVGTASCRWGWQTYAWSAGRISPKAHFRQYLNGQNICGGTVDLNETYRVDYGQWPRPSVPPPLPDPIPIVEDIMPIPVIGAPGDVGLRPWTALMPGKIIRFVNWDPLPESTPDNQWLNGDLYWAGIDAGYLLPVHYVDTVDNYDEACLLAQQSKLP